MILLRIFRDGLLGGPPLPPGCLLMAIVALLGLLGCGVVGLVENVATLGGVSYWAAQTGTPRPTVTVFLGTTTPVYAATLVPGEVTTTPGVFITETPPLPMTTTPALNLIGLTTPEPTETPYYRVGSFYMNSDVYIGGPDGLVFRVTGHETQAIPRRANAAYHFITLYVTNYGSAAVIVPVSDVLFIRHVEQGGGVKLTGRWTAQNEPLIARGLPSYEAQQLEPLQAGATREFVAGFVVPEGEVRELGLITNWATPVEGGLPVWFFLEDDPLGPFVDAVRPPPPTPAVLDEAGTFAGSDPGNGAIIGTPSPVVGRWPTTGRITRGFGCHEYYTGISGEGWGCPEETPWFHNGVDIANSTGTAIVSPVDGTMQYAGPNSAGPDCAHIAGSEGPHEGLGNYQRLAGGGTVHYFGHLSSFAVTSGDVTAGQTVAGMGSTGCST
ncbi:MAG: M23 family metallopeptidase, partial [Chloroflexi bacterium]|nr:M23 family metallopeptidase [Chloroflexota bacterium]